MRDQEPGSPWEGFEVISSYSRAQAIADGVLVDVSQHAGELGITWPVAVTRALWDGQVVPSERSRQRGQSEAGRLHDLLWIFRTVARNASGDTVHFLVLFEHKGRARKVMVKAVLSLGDSREPVFTLMLPEED